MEESQDPELEKKVKRNTIEDAIKAANLIDYLTPQPDQAEKQSVNPIYDYYQQPQPQPQTQKLTNRVNLNIYNNTYYQIPQNQYIISNQQQMPMSVISPGIAQPPSIQSPFNMSQPTNIYSLLQQKGPSSQLSQSQQNVFANQQQSQQGEIKKSEEEINQEKKKTRWGTAAPPQQNNSNQQSILQPISYQELMQKKFGIQFQQPKVPPPLEQQQQKSSQFPVFTSSLDLQQLPPKQVTQPNTSNQFPPDLNEYVQKGFAKCQNSSERKQMEKYLKSIINIAKMKNEIAIRNWKEFQLPLLPRERTSLVGEVEGNASVPVPNIFNIQSGQTEIKPPPLPASVIKPTFPQQLQQPQLLQQMQQSWWATSTEDTAKINKRFERFKSNILSSTNTASKFKQLQMEEIGEDYDFEKLCQKWKIIVILNAKIQIFIFKGQCTKLEKPYLRLTSQPDPATVRPENILKKALKMFLGKWKASTIEYNAISEQFRSMRQDMTIQHIRNKFTVKVYENNARIALECHDLNQFNQCSSRLYDLYKEEIQGNKYEFICYRLMYLILSKSQYELNRLLIDLINHDYDLNNKNIKFALEVRNAYANGNIKRLFTIYKNAPNMCSYLIDMFITKLRVWAMQIICKSFINYYYQKILSFGQQINIEIITEFMAFEKEEDCKYFLTQASAVFILPEKKKINAKESLKKFLEHPILKSKEYITKI